LVLIPETAEPSERQGFLWSDWVEKKKLKRLSLPVARVCGGSRRSRLLSESWGGIQQQGRGQHREHSDRELHLRSLHSGCSNRGIVRPASNLTPLRAAPRQHTDNASRFVAQSGCLPDARPRLSRRGSMMR